MDQYLQITLTRSLSGAINVGSVGRVLVVFDSHFRVNQVSYDVHACHCSVKNAFQKLDLDSNLVGA